MTEYVPIPPTKNQLPPEQIVALKQRFSEEVILLSFVTAYRATEVRRDFLVEHPEGLSQTAMADLASVTADYTGHLQAALDLPAAEWPAQAVSTVELGTLIEVYDTTRSLSDGATRG